MKFILLFFFTMYSCTKAIAQLSENAEYAKTKDIKDEKGKVIGKMTIVPGLKTEVALKNCIRKIDSAGHYITKYTFVKPNHAQANNTTLVLQFDKYFEDVFFDTIGEVDNIRTTIADNKLGASFQASRLSVDAVIEIKVISNKPLFATITGISGQLIEN